MVRTIKRRPESEREDGELGTRWAVGEQVRRLRTHAGLSQGDLAERLRREAGATILRDGINDLERGRRELRPDLLLGLSLVLQVPPLDILAGPDTEEDLLVLGRSMTAQDYARWMRGDVPPMSAPMHQAPQLALHERVEQLERRLAALEDRLSDHVPT